MKAPRSNPNSSDSSSSEGSAAQFTFTNGLSRRGDACVDGARHQLLAGAALAADQHRDVGVGDAGDEVLHFAHLLVASEQHAGDARRTRAVRVRTRHVDGGVDRRGFADRSSLARPRIAHEWVQHFTVVLLSKVNATSGNVS